MKLKAEFEYLHLLLFCYFLSMQNNHKQLFHETLCEMLNKVQDWEYLQDERSTGSAAPGSGSAEQDSRLQGPNDACWSFVTDETSWCPETKLSSLRLQERIRDANKASNYNRAIKRHENKG